MTRLVCLVAALLWTPSPAVAGESVWLRSLAPAEELIERMRRLRLGATAWTAGPDLSWLRAEAQDLRRKVDEAENPPPGIGLFFEGQSTRVSQLLIGGPAESAGLAIGDEIVSVNGVPVADNMAVVGLVNEARGPIEVTVKRKAGRLSLTKRPPEYLSAEFLAGIEARCRALLAETSALERAARAPGADIAARAESLAARIRALEDELLKAQIQAFTTRYRSR